MGLIPTVTTQFVRGLPLLDGRSLRLLTCSDSAVYRSEQTSSVVNFSDTFSNSLSMAEEISSLSSARMALMLSATYPTAIVMPPSSPSLTQSVLICIAPCTTGSP